ncbi:MAG: extracellular solute-binding protein, partial [Armatimonadota bacterium]|nr:extracellular solute-binding protein [Armatimonadota bacterium]
FKGKDKTQGIDIDLFFGGGAETFMELQKDGLLEPLPSDFGVPAKLNGVPLRGAGNEWIGAALSSFGILVNKGIVARDKLPTPAVWADLGNPKLRNRIELADPRHSGSAHMAYEIILQTNGWDRGWQILTAMAGNARSFVDSSSRLVQDVQNGEAVASPAIDFYARTAVAKAGYDKDQTGVWKLAYVEPRGQLVVTADPIGMLRGAPHPELARAFVEFVLSPSGQKLWMYKKGAPGGPVENELGRMAVLPALYKPLADDSIIRSDPFSVRNTRPYDSEKASARRTVLDALIGAVLIDNHSAVQTRWKKTPDAAKITFVPVTEAELAALAAKWDDPTVQSTKQAEWGQAAREHFSKE